MGGRGVSGVLLDTHTLVWLLIGDRRFSPAVAEFVQQAAATNQAYVSAITPLGGCHARGQE